MRRSARTVVRTVLVDLLGCYARVLRRLNREAPEQLGRKVKYMTCVVPSGRWAAAARDASITVRRASWRVVALVTSLAVAFFAGFLADRASGRSVAVGLIAVLALVATPAVLYIALLVHAVRGVDNEAHWTPQVFHAYPDYAGAEFDLWSNCNHELHSARADVIEPDGRRLRGLTIEPSQHNVVRGGYLSGGTYPTHHPGASPVRFGQVYTVVWTAKATPDSRDVEIARQDFVLPIEGRRSVGAGLLRPPPMPNSQA